MFKKSDHKIFILDLGERSELGKFRRFKRAMLPLLISLSVGLYSFTTFAPVLGYPLEIFSQSGYSNFLAGYVILCFTPMVISFLIFSPLIAGNYLLDDAGVVFYLESRKYREPGDVEPISIWAQSFIKGIAGVTTFISFANFFGEFIWFMILSGMDVSLFWGVLYGLGGLALFFGMPISGALAYMLLAIDVMDFNCQYNSERLYNRMEKYGFDTTPREIIIK